MLYVRNIFNMGTGYEMRNLGHHVLCLPLIMISVLALGAQNSEIQLQSAAKKISQQIELGLSAGSPAGGNAAIGYWGSPSLPIVARAFGSHWGYGYGAGAELGWLFDSQGSLRQYVAAGGEFGAFFWPFSLHTGEGAGGGLHYGLNWKGLSVDVGINVGSIRWGWFLWELDNYVGILPSAQIGYSWFIDI